MSEQPQQNEQKQPVVWRRRVVAVAVVVLVAAIAGRVMLKEEHPTSGGGSGLTLGLFLILINTALLALTAWISGKFESIHFAIDGFWSAVWGAIIVSLVSFLLSRVFNPGKIAERLG